jgi:PAS domain S-box-containing protein
MSRSSFAKAALLAENAELRARLEEAEDMLRAIRGGEVDALVVESAAGPQVFTLQGLDAELNRFRGDILEQVSDAVIVLDDDQYVTYLNAAAARQYGVATSQALGCHVKKIFQTRWLHAGDEAGAATALRETGRWRGENIHVKNNGESLHVESLVTRLHAANGTHSGLLAVIRDITRNKLNERLLVESQQRYVDIVEAAMDAIITVDADQHILVFNAAAEKMFDCPAQEAIGAALGRFIPERYCLVEGGPVAAPGRRQAEALSVVSGLRANGGEFPIEMTISQSGTNSEKSFTAILRDVSERKRAEELLRASQKDNKFLADLIRASSQAMAIGYPDGRLGLVNAAFGELTGYPAEELRRIDWATQLTPPEWRELEREKLAELQRASQPVRYEKEYLRKDGSRVPVELLVHYETGAEDARPFYYAFITDISERKQAQMAIHEREERLRLFIRHTPAGIAMLDQKLCYLAASNRWKQDYGLPEDCDVAGLSHYALFPDIPEHWKEIHRRCLAGETLSADEDAFRRADGTTHWIKWEVRPWFTGEGRVGGILIAAEEVTESVLAKRALHKSEARLAAIVHQATAGLAETDLTGRFILVNEHFCAMVARSREELLAMHWRDITHPDDLPENDTLFRLCAEEGRDFVIEKRYLRPGGSVVWIRNNVSLLRNDKNQPVSMLAVSFDIGERRQIETRLREQALQLHEADRRKDEFLAMLAHELRNPLVPILNAVQILKCISADNARIMWCGDIISRQVDHLTRMVNDLLEVSRINQGKIELKKETLAAADFILPALETSQPLMDARRQEFSLALPPQTLSVNGDRVRLTQMIANLLNNASKFTEAGGHIALAVEAGKDEIRIRVSDTGCGIEPSALPHLFDLFYQVSGNLARSQGGLGIGLALVHRLVTLHGGSVRAFSAGLGEGSEFEVRLPLVAVVKETATDAGAALSLSVGSELRILVVDDIPDVAESLAWLLEFMGHEVWMAHDGLAAIESALGRRPDVVILDIGLPGMDGYEVAARLRQCGELEGIHIIALSGYAPPNDPEKLHGAGIDAYLVKPVDITQLEKLLEDYRSP